MCALRPAPIGGLPTKIQKPRIPMWPGGRRRNAHDVGSDVRGLLIAPAGTLGMDMGGGCAEKNNVAAAPEAKP